MLPASSLSRVANELRDLLMHHIGEIDRIDQIKIGHPGDTIKDLEDLEDLGEIGLNLFFYDLNYDGYPSDGTSDNPFYIRLYCLITAVGCKKDVNNMSISKGENELRLIGEVMRILHQQSLLSLDDGDDNEIAQLQIVPHTMSLDNLNHIWSTQSDISYRLSVAYEMSLVPVPYTLATDLSPRVGNSQMVTWGEKTRPEDKEKEGIISLMPAVEYLEIDCSSENWVPHICMVEKIDASQDKLHYVFLIDDPENEIDILIAGKNNGKVKLCWNVWRRKKDNSIVAWKEDIADSVQPVIKEIKDTQSSTESFLPSHIDPDDIDSRRVFKVKLPDDVRLNDTKTWQAMLYAIHEEPLGSGELKTDLIKSNSVLLYGERS